MKFATIVALTAVVSAENMNQQMKRLNHDLQVLKMSNRPSTQAAPQQLWSVGMTASKTAAVNQKLQKVAQDYMAFASDPVYGPFLEQHQTQLYMDIDAAFTKYMTVMENKYNSDPVFRAKADAYVATEEALGNELNNPTGWTFEDNDGALGQAANQW
mgnify:FL=1